MNDNELDTLKAMEMVEPSEQARQQAIHAAMMAFDEAATKNTSESKKSFQGIFSPVRLLINVLENTGESIMRKRVLVGAMASVVVAVPVAMVLFADDIKNKKSPEDILSGIECCAELEESVAEVEATTVRKGNKPANLIIDGKSIPLSVAQRGGVAPDDKKSKPIYERLPSTPVSPEEKAEQRMKVASVRRQASGTRVLGKVSIGSGSSASDKVAEVDISGNKHSLTQPRFGLLGKKHPKARFAQRPMKPGSISDAEEDTDELGGSIGVEVREKFDDRADSEDRDRFAKVKDRGVLAVRDKPVSTFSIDVDTSSYSFMRRMLNGGRMPRKDSVRVEELINYFKYDYQRPETAEVPFKANVAVYPTPWNKNTKLLHIGIKGHDIVPETKPRSNLVFLIDVSGSMGQKDKLPLLKSAFRILVNKLDKEDLVSIVVYAGRSATVLEPTKVADKGKILSALNGLKSGGSTAGAQGIQKAYALARKHFDKDGVNRVILATDGDFNVGLTGDDDLKTYIEKQRKSGIFLSILGFGQGNYNDSLMQVLAQNGNGTAAYIDSLKEAQKVLVDEASSTLFTIAKDVKIQVEFNPAQVSEYRLIGYETRALKREDFNNDKVDAGDIGSGHTVTAIYEIVPAGAKSLRFDKLRYGAKKDEAQSAEGNKSGEYAFLKMRYKLPKEDKSKLVTFPITSENEKKSIDEVSADMRFAASVAAFGQKLRDNRFLSEYGFEDIRKLAAGARGEDAYGYRSEFLGLVGLAKSLEKSE